MKLTQVFRPMALIFSLIVEAAMLQFEENASKNNNSKPMSRWSAVSQWIQMWKITSYKSCTMSHKQEAISSTTNEKKKYLVKKPRIKIFIDCSVIDFSL